MRYPKNMVNKGLREIFKNGSRTFYNSSKFFPPLIRDEVTVLYSFVRKADNFVDSIPQQREEFYKFKEDFLKARKNGTCGDKVVDSFVGLEKKYNCDSVWALSFLESMEQDLTKNSYETIEETEKYIYGSAGTVGQFMAKIMGLAEGSYFYAQLLGKSFQFINFIRDIGEDQLLERVYFPRTDLKSFGLNSLSFEEASQKKASFEQFVRFELERYESWQKEAEKGFLYIPAPCLIPIKTASDMYKWTGEQIKKDPLIVYRKQVKPSMGMIRNYGRDKFFL